MLIVYNPTDNTIIDKLPEGFRLEGVNPELAVVDVPGYVDNGETSIGAIPAALVARERATLLQNKLAVLVAELNAKYEGLGLSVNDTRAAAEVKLFDAKVTWEEVMKLNYVYSLIGGK